MPKLILASASPRRSELLRQLGMRFDVIPGTATEIQSNDFSPGELAQMNALLKARSIARKHPKALVIGMDTVVAVDNQIFGKPASLDEAHDMLKQLQGRSHQVVTGVCLRQLEGQRVVLFAEQTMVTFKPMTSQEIKAYHAQVNPLDKAGGYGIQEKGELLGASVQGSFTNVVGLPVERLQEELQLWKQEPVLC